MTPKVVISEAVLRDVRCNDFDARVEAEVNAAVAGLDKCRVALFDALQSAGKGKREKTETK